jgi:predicted small secreted protein
MPSGTQAPIYLRSLYKIRLQEGWFRVSRRVMKSFLLIALAAAAVLSSSCNTFIGIGRDMRLAGEGMEKTANKASGGGGATEDTSGAPVY